MIVTRNRLTSEEKKEIQDLVSLCQDKDGISLSYPLNEEDVWHFLFFQEDGPILAVLSLVSFTDTVAECTAFTLPAYRKKGYFSLLLQTAIEKFPERDLLFPVAEECSDTMATLKAMEAVLDSCELEMERSLEDESLISPFPQEESYTLLCSPMDDENIAWVLVSAENPEEIFGFCQTTSAGKALVCLHHVEILPLFRKEGRGTALIYLLLRRLKADGIRRVILQVSADNTAAVALYRKTGFRVSETLSYYLY